MEYYAAERKKELLPFVTAWMDLENTMLTEKSVTEDHMLYDFIYMKCPN